ncbi:hypothetical protein NQ314_013552 [Rhamnusium bicolor]|uniref:Poly [ADP-ribose] polymerase n=1 Tax=Rhamnusium bicolor TaxID=1586634 RepID=A0AAV8X6K0_9CUCU|nr:hypothetical protein NQ314_013552 [Rhamnusium bicolor]
MKDTKKLNHSSPEFKNIQLLFSNISYYKLTDVEVVFNPYLKKKFELRRQLVFGGIQPIRLFHGTKEKYIDSICNHNFDWRCYRRNRHRYGKGVNFTPDIGYAAIYCDKRKGKIMIMADVLVKKDSSWQ